MGDVHQFEATIDAALEIGYRHFDTAYQYQNEKHIGNVLQRWLNEGRIQRKDLFIVTKVWMLDIVGFGIPIQHIMYLC